ncbi:hypothetical protein GOQ29_14100 [Clostridium sp. D2Q-14]|uniref:hypothetical protein n=1 Tax=Anaeromonas gelatinilytica TaxID=2683194 RepID=UPI00193C2718|nr:hypothetical protein [Anaeromonas gelatinilytica]MBS4536752.1 hypothetical protein [Anaeromonas gelatinilytica]
MLSNILSKDIYNKNVLLLNNDYNKSKISVKNYIIESSKRNQKVILLDSFWSKEKYSRFKSSTYKENIERRYHMKISVEDFLYDDNIIEYMNAKNINIVKIKSIVGYMSAAELFPVIMSKLDEIIEDECVHVLLNDHVLDSLKWNEIVKVINSVNQNNIRLIVLTDRDNIPKELIEKCEIIINN